MYVCTMQQYPIYAKQSTGYNIYKNVYKNINLYEHLQFASGPIFYFSKDIANMMGVTIFIASNSSTSYN